MPESEEATTPSAEYDVGQEQVTVTLTKNQIALIVFTLMEQSKAVPVREQIEWSRLAIGLNDLIVEDEHAPVESG
jgi:hypothetical protein